MEKGKKIGVEEEKRNNGEWKRRSIGGENEIKGKERLKLKKKRMFGVEFIENGLKKKIEIGKLMNDDEYIDEGEGSLWILGDDFEILGKFGKSGGEEVERRWGWELERIENMSKKKGMRRNMRNES